MSTTTTHAALLEFVDLVADACERHRRFATISLYLVPDQLPFVTIVDDPCTVLEFHSELSAAADACELHRTRSVPVGNLWEYHYTPLPEVADLYGHG